MSHERITELLVAAARESFTRMRERHPDEDFYCYALHSVNDGFSSVEPTCNSEQALRRTMAHYEDLYQRWGWSQGPVTDDLRWNVADWPYAQEAEEIAQAQCDAVWETLWKREHPLDYDVDDLGGEVEAEAAVEREVRVRIEAAIAALAQLDAEGFFGSGEQRDRVILAVLCGDGHEAEAEAVERLNAAETVSRFFPGMVRDAFVSED